MKPLRVIFITVVGALALGICTTPRASAQANPSPEALQAARELTSIFNDNTISEFNRNLMDQFWPGIASDLQRKNAKMDTAKINELRRELDQEQHAAMRDSLKDIAAIYARHFTVEEMRAMAAFYKTPAGAKALKVMPVVTAELLAVMRPRLQTMQKNVAHAVAKLLLESDNKSPDKQ